MDMLVTEGGSLWQRITSGRGLTTISHYFVMDWASVWTDIVGGLLIAGTLAAWVPSEFWQSFFLVDHPTITKIWGPDRRTMGCRHRVRVLRRENKHSLGREHRLPERHSDHGMQAIQRILTGSRCGSPRGLLEALGHLADRMQKQGILPWKIMGNQAQGNACGLANRGNCHVLVVAFITAATNFCRLPS